MMFGPVLMAAPAAARTLGSDMADTTTCGGVADTRADARALLSGTAGAAAAVESLRADADAMPSSMSLRDRDTDTVSTQSAVPST
jgi:hypothetical protein